MDLSLTGGGNNGSHYSPITIDNLRQSGANPTVFNNRITFSSMKLIRDDSPVLESLWQYWIFYKDVEAYWFDSGLAYSITNEHIPVTLEQCEGIVKHTYQRLQSTWEERKNNEVNFFPSIQDITLEALNLAVQELMKTLVDEL
jgi:hypothetical protein